MGAIRPTATSQKHWLERLISLEEGTWIKAFSRRLNVDNAAIQIWRTNWNIFFIKHINMKPVITHITRHAITSGMCYAALCACVMLIAFSACAFVPTASNFPRDKVRLGMNTKEVKGIMGKPFSEDTFVEDRKHVDIFHYKEAVRVKTQGFILTTSLRFENDSLTAITQNEKMVEEVTIEK